VNLESDESGHQPLYKRKVNKKVFKEHTLKGVLLHLQESVKFIYGAESFSLLSLQIVR